MKALLIWNILILLAYTYFGNINNSWDIVIMTLQAIIVIYYMWKGER